MQKFIGLVLALVISAGHIRAAVVIDGIAYNLNETELTAEVTFGGSCSEDIVIPESITYSAKTYSVTSIGKVAFYNCSDLTSITIPNSVTSIGNLAFLDCTGLTSVVVEKGNSVYDSRNNCNAIIETATNTLIAGCQNTIIPNSVTSIGNSAFDGCSGLTSITIPNSVTSIGNQAFSGCTGLTSVTIPNSVDSIGSQAFRGCTGLTSMDIPNSVICIGGWAFSSCTHLTSVTIGNSVDSVGEWTFFNCTRLTSISVVDGNTVYDSRNNCNAIIETASNTLIAGCKTTAIPNSVTSIRRCAFVGCKGLTSVSIPSGVKSIGDCAFEECTRLTSVTIGNSVTDIGNCAFRSCSSLTSVTIPNSVTSIGYMAFSSCTGMTSVTIGNGVTSIGDSAVFSGCKSLTSIYNDATTPQSITSDVFGIRLSSCTLHVPCGSLAAYQATSVWQDFGTIVESAVITWSVGETSTTNDVECGEIPIYNGGATPTKPATEKYTYSFKGWEPEIAAVTGNATYTAQFDSTLIEYEIDTNPGSEPIEGGSVHIDGTPNYGETITLTPIEEDGYVFVEWSDGNTDNPREVVVDGDVNVYPIFHKCEEIITLTEIVIGKGESYEFGGKLYSTRGVYYDTITLATGCDSISTLKLSVVKKKTFNLRAVVDSTQMAYGTAIGSGIYNDGQTVTIEAVPASSKYVFARWWNPDEGIEIFENPYTFTLTRNLTVKAVFKRAPKRIIVKQQGASHAMSHVETDIVAVIEVGERTATVNNTSESTYRIYDSAGHLVITSAEDNTYALPSGLYFIHIDGESEKFIIQ